MMLRDLAWLGIIIMTMNAGVAVVSANVDDGSFAAQVFGAGGVLNWMPDEVQATSVDINYMDTNALLVNSEEREGFVAQASQSITTIPLIGSVWSFFLSIIDWLTLLYGILALLLGGVLILLLEVGAPPYVAFLFGVPTIIISAAGMFSLLEHALTAMRGVR